MISEALEEKIENFSRLSDEECASIISNQLLEALESDLYIDWEIVAKFLTIPYEIREPLCKLFNTAIKRNNQKIGNYTIGEWIRKYQDQYINKERTPNTFFEYTGNDPEVKKLPRREQLKLARILRMYDYLFIVPIYDLEGPVNNILRFAMRSDSTPQELSAQIRASIMEQQVPQKIVTENLSINDALKTYPDLGEQLITSNYIHLKSFPQPVRPSIKNWISDYTFNLGFGEHNSMERGNYLYKNDNARVLGTQDKERLSYILKAVDENQVVTINTATKQVVFPDRKKEAVPAIRQERGREKEAGSSEQRTTNNYQERGIPQKQSSYDAPLFHRDLSGGHMIIRGTKEEDENQMPTANIQFSSHQTLPFEKNQNQPPRQSSPAQTRFTPPAPTRPAEPKQPQPLRIHPISNSPEKSENRSLPRNVVNLKEQ